MTNSWELPNTHAPYTCNLIHIYVRTYLRYQTNIAYETTGIVCSHYNHKSFQLMICIAPSNSWTSNLDVSIVVVMGWRHTTPHRNVLASKKQQYSCTWPPLRPPLYGHHCVTRAPSRVANAKFSFHAKCGRGRKVRSVTRRKKNVNVPQSVQWRKLGAILSVMLGDLVLCSFSWRRSPKTSRLLSLRCTPAGTHFRHGGSEGVDLMDDQVARQPFSSTQKYLFRKKTDVCIKSTL